MRHEASRRPRVVGELARPVFFVGFMGAGKTSVARRLGFVVYLKVTADEAKSRISATSTRPLFQDLDAARKTSEERLPLYAEVADLTIDTAGKNVATIAREVQSALEKEGILCLQRK